jgi:hypothetical protein
MNDEYKWFTAAELHAADIKESISKKENTMTNEYAITVNEWFLLLCGQYEEWKELTAQYDPSAPDLELLAKIEEAREATERLASKFAQVMYIGMDLKNTP